jgi:predicted Zn-dependent peptidase
MEGSLALGLALAARGRRGEAPGSLRRRLDEAGAKLELKAISYDAVALELVCQPADLPDLLVALVEACADPAFAASDFPQREFDGVLRDFRVARLREEADPALRATDRLRKETFGEHPYAAPPFGSDSSLLALKRGTVATAWQAGVGPGRVAISVVGDLDGQALADRLSPALARWEGGSRRAESVPPLPFHADQYAEAMPSAAGAYLSAGFKSPAVTSPDYPALLVALAMLDDLILEECGRSGLSVYGVSSRLSFAAAPSGSIVILRASSAARAEVAVESAFKSLAGGNCLSLSAPTPSATSSMVQPTLLVAQGASEANMATALPAYKSRALARLYSHAASAADMAERMARDLCSGGDGSAWFRLADRIAAVRLDDLVSAASTYLRAGNMAWVTVAPQALLDGIPGARQ